MESPSRELMSVILARSGKRIHKPHVLKTIDRIMQIVIKRAGEQGIDLKTPEGIVDIARPKNSRNRLLFGLRFIGFKPK
jgi:hypothetical protein